VPVVFLAPVCGGLVGLPVAGYSGATVPIVRDHVEYVFHTGQMSRLLASMAMDVVPALRTVVAARRLVRSCASPLAAGCRHNHGAVTGPIADLSVLLKSLTPVLHDGIVAFCAVDGRHGEVALDAIATFRESEGMTVVLDEGIAVARGLTPLFRAAWITLTVHSDLNAVGLTAAVSTALAKAGISCNVIAAVHHDHLFVPVDRAEDAMHALRALSDPERTVV